MAAWQPLLLSLVGVALTLTGCGGDQKKVNDAPAQLTSQTFSGDWSGHITVLGILADFTAQVSVSFDADALNMRVDGVVNSKLVNITGPQNFSVILHAGNKRATIHLPAKLPLLVPFPSCIYKELPQLPPVELMKSLLRDEMQSRKPDGMDGDFRQWVWDLSPQPGVTGHAWADLDDSNGFRKASESIHVDQNKTKLDAATTFMGTGVQIAKPDPSLFEVPASWAPCVKMPNHTAAAAARPQPLPFTAALLEHVSALVPNLATAEPRAAARAEVAVVV